MPNEIGQVSGKALKKEELQISLEYEQAIDAEERLLRIFEFLLQEPAEKSFAT